MTKPVGASWPSVHQALRSFLRECPQPTAPPDGLTASYWASEEPLNPVDALVLSLRSAPGLAHLRHMGAEWWWQDTDDRDPPKAYHTDCNVSFCHDKMLKSFPQWSSVLYLTAMGGCTTVFQAEELLAVEPRVGRRPRDLIRDLDYIV